MQYPAKTIEDAFRACDPAENLVDANDPRYVDFAAARGEDGTAASFCLRRIELSVPPLVQLLAGHRGCGKSTELRQLQNALINSGFAVAFIDAEVDLDLEDTEPTDILLALIRGLEETLRSQNITLPQAEIERFMNWFSNVVVEKTVRQEFDVEVKSEAELKAGIPFFASLMSKITGRIKTGTDSKRTVRQNLEPKLSQLLDRGRLLFQKARSEVRAKGKRDLVVIVDGLDRIALKSKSDGRTTHEVLFIDRGDLLKGFDCHTILTVPISLMFSSQAANLAAVFPDRQVLPMVKINDRDGHPSAEGIQLMRTVLEKRVDVDRLMEAGTVERLIEASGGHPRQLMQLIRSAVVMVDEAPITMTAVENAIHKLRNDYGRSIPEEHWPLLAHVARRHSVKNDAAHQMMLYNLSVLEYQNAERWCDVNPVVRDLPPFVAALKEIEPKGPVRKKSKRTTAAKTKKK